jgi:hypothetical protein
LLFHFETIPKKYGMLIASSFEAQHGCYVQWNWATRCPFCYGL